MKYRLFGIGMTIVMVLSVTALSFYSPENPQQRVHQHLTARGPDEGCDCDGTELCTHLPLVIIDTNGQAIPGQPTGDRDFFGEEIYTIGEWQANTISASLLMPVPIMKKALRKFNGGRRLPVYGETVFHPREKVILQKMASSLGVSFTALVIRLRGLGMLSRHSIGEYIGSELRFGGDTS